MHATASVTSIMLLAVTAGCATSLFDQHFEQARYAAAAAAFEQDSSLHQDEEALFRAGLVRAFPSSPAFDPALALAHFSRLEELFPDSPHRIEALRLVALLEDRSRIQSELEMYRADLNDLRTRITAFAERQRRMEQQGEERDAEVARLETLATQLEDRLRQRSGELATLRQELERLKAIDLRSSRSRTRSGDGGPDTRGSGSRPK